MQVTSAIPVLLNIASLLEEAVEARNAACKSWAEALTPLDQKLAHCDRILRDWHACEGAAPEVQAELLALAKNR